MPLPDANVDFEKLPDWMSSTNWYNLAYPKQWTKLLNNFFNRITILLKDSMLWSIKTQQLLLRKRCKIFLWS